MYEGHDLAIAVLLRAANALSPAAQAELEEACRLTGRSLADLAVERRFITAPELLRRVADQLGLELADAVPGEIAEAMAALLPPELARRRRVAPWRADDQSVAVLAADPFESGAAADLAFALGRPVRLVVADAAAIARLVERHYGLPDAGGRSPASGIDEAEPGGHPLSAAELARMAGEHSVVDFVNRMLTDAVRDRASDIHFEPFDRELRVRCRVDGLLRESAVENAVLTLPVISRLKVMAGLNIAERRAPQDGRLAVAVDGRPVDLRISTLPTQSGESVVLRVLDAAAAPGDLAALGLPAPVEAGLRAAIARPHGLLVVTGPTGCGKTTTLYGCLRVLNRSGVKILTAEDPVEYEIDGVMQVPVAAATGLTFAAAMRSFLRHDPDVLMVGEIRDLATAQTAVQAALTGHLVLSTLHTRDAAGAIARLVDMGVEPYLVCATLEGVLAQRLVRRVCPDCSSPAAPDATALSARRRGRGCPACRHTGYRGRLGIFEWMPMTEPIRELVVRGASTMEIRAAAVAAGMETLHAAGLRAAGEGLTTTEEVDGCA